MCFIKKIPSILLLESCLNIKCMCCGPLKVSFFLILHINPSMRLLKAILPSFFHEIDSMYTTLMYGLSPFLFALEKLEISTRV